MESRFIQVMPVLSAFPALEISQEDFVGPIPPWRLQLRKQRMQSALDIPQAVALALPGALASSLPQGWDGQFHVGSYQGTLRSKMTDQIARGEPIEPLLNQINAEKKQVSSLVSWVENLDVTPITAEAAAGEMVSSEVGPIVVNLFEESFRVRATIGMALVASDGRVILRYRDEFESILGEQRNTQRVGRDLAMGLAKEITKMWPVDPDFYEQAI